MIVTNAEKYDYKLIPAGKQLFTEGVMMSRRVAMMDDKNGGLSLQEVPGSESLALRIESQAIIFDGEKTGYKADISEGTYSTRACEVPGMKGNGGCELRSLTQDDYNRFEAYIREAKSVADNKLGLQAFALIIKRGEIATIEDLLQAARIVRDNSAEVARIKSMAPKIRDRIAREWIELGFGEPTEITPDLTPSQP